MDSILSDAIFNTTNNTNALLLSRLKRTEGSIPYIRAANQVFSGSAVKSPAAGGVNPVSSGNYASGLINPDTGVQSVGNNTPFYLKGVFNFRATPTSITIYWDGSNGSQVFVIKRVDGTSHTVPKGNMTITGLSPNTAYGFLPYNCLTNQTSLSFSVGDAGSPRYAFSPSASQELIATANQNQKLASNEAITSAFIYFITPPGGTATGIGEYGTPSPYNQQRFAP
jgi:hypothetical protein